jgi:4-aminobutyrate aminotransferase
MLMRPAGPKTPDLVTALPGPNARALIERDERFTSGSYTRGYPLAVARGEGATIVDVDGNRFLDFTAGIAVCSTGHCHPRVVRAVQQQAGRLLHMSGTDFYYEPQSKLAEKLAQIAPGGDPKRVFFTNSGAESVEAAFKLARYHTGRPQMIAFTGAFHGRTMGALSLTGSKAIQRRGFAPLVPQVAHIDYADPYRYGEQCAARSIEQLENLFKRTVPPDEVAAIFVEPIQGEGGYIVPPAQFHLRLKQIAEKHGILLVADEVQAGMGRTGEMFAMQHFGVEPDIICLAKGIATGLPLGAIIARGELMNWPPGSHASTFGGNPVSCVAALETIALLEEELIENARQVGSYLLQTLRELMADHTLIGDVRGLGLMIGMELVRDRTSKERAAKERDELVDRCFYKGLLLLGCGENTVRFCPPLVISRDEADTAVEIVAEVLGEIEGAAG